jgi:DNA-binding CsgD family transcriptional regulator
VVRARGLGKARWQREAIPEALAAFEAARALLAGRLLPETVALLVDLASLLTLSLHRQSEGLRCARQALALARQLEDVRLVAAASRALGNLLARANELPEGIALLRAALDLAVTADDPAAAAECCACLRMVSTWNNDYRGGLAYAHREIAFARRCQMPSLLRHVYTHLAVFALCQGRLSEAEQWLATAEPLLAQLGHPEAAAYLEWIKGSVAWARGDYATAERLVGGAVAAFRRLNPSTVVWYLGMLALVQARGGKSQEARRCLDELEGLAATLPERSMPRAQILSWVAETALALGDRERLLALYAPMSPFRDRGLDRPIARLLGEIEILRGEFAAAEASLAAAEEVCRRENYAWELAALLAARANLEQVRGGPGSAARARSLLGEAQAIYRRYGNDAEVRRLGERLRALPTQPGARSPAPLPAGLSAREAEVLRLVADGKGNREIAAALHLSASTVAHHLTSIYTKAGVDNRSAAAAFAIRHGLA